MAYKCKIGSAFNMKNSSKPWRSLLLSKLMPYALLFPQTAFPQLSIAIRANIWSINPSFSQLCAIDAILKCKNN